MSLFILSLHHHYSIVFYLEKRNITDERQALKDALQVLEDELAKPKPTNNGTDDGTYHYYKYLNRSERSGGESDNTPHLGDLSVYGVLRGLDGLPIHTEIMNEFGRIAQWYQQMKRVVEK
jgi:hypothetical protein